MRRWILVSAVLTFTFLLASCRTYDKHGDLHFSSYQVYFKEHGICEMYNTELIYEDDDFTYFLGASGCEQANYYFIKDEGRYVTIYEAIENNIISIDDVLDSDYSHIIVEEK